MFLHIVQFGDPVLRQKCTPVTEFNNETLIKLIADITQTIKEAPASALAAPQVAKPIQLAVIDVGEPSDKFPYTFFIDGKTGPYELFFPLTLINPKITYTSAQKDTYDEGCMSIDNIRINVKRPTDIIVKYQDETGTHHTIETNGMMARCLQHEIDHLKGILMIDHATPQELNRVQARLKKLKRETRDFIKSQKSK